MLMNVNNPGDNKAKIRIKLPFGAEFEAEGSETFVTSQKEEFLKSVSGSRNGEPHKEKESENRDSIWPLIIGFKKEIPYIIRKVSTLEPHEAALIIMAGQRAIKGQEEISAINLSKGLKLSGLKSKRIDREINAYIKENKISAFGFKRSRSYKINPKGIQDAYLKALEIIKS